jgi:acetolactate synthase-1/2/3 large subunit
MSGAQQRAANALAESLVLNGIDRAFCVPGESYLALLDALRDLPELDVVTCRHEGGAALMAVADARLTGRPSLALVSRGPGAANAAIAVHVADQDGVPLILLIGQVERRNLGRGAFQEVDYERMFGDMCRWVHQVHDPDRLPEVVARAIHAACGPSPGPVVLAIPEDVLSLACGAAPLRATVPPSSAPARRTLERALAMLRAARSPLLLAGSGLRSERGRRALLQASEHLGLPVAVTNKQQDIFPNDHSSFAGHVGYAVPPALGAALARSDLVLAVGTRLGDVSTQNFAFPKAPVPEQPLIHVHPDPAVPGRNHQTTLAVAAAPDAFLECLTDLSTNGPSLPDWSSWRSSLVALREQLSVWTPLSATDGIDFGHAVAAVRERLADDAVVCADAGNFVTWVHAFLPLRGEQRFVGAVCGAMGLGVPAAVAAALRYPRRQVVAFVGDGGLLMTGCELAVAVARGLRLRIVVSNNRSYGTIRTHQEREFPGRTSATDLANPDFAAMARSFGATGGSVRTAADLAAVFDEAFAADGPAVVEVRSSLQIIAANRKLPEPSEGRNRRET